MFDTAVMQFWKHPTPKQETTNNKIFDPQLHSSHAFEKEIYYMKVFFYRIMCYNINIIKLSLIHSPTFDKHTRRQVTFVHIQQQLFRSKKEYCL